MSSTYWCVLRREWMGCWGLLGLLLVMKWIIPENSLRLAPVRQSPSQLAHPILFPHYLIHCYIGQPIGPPTDWPHLNTWPILDTMSKNKHVF